MERVLIGLIFFVITSVSQAKVLVITDIDDTIRLIHREANLAQQALNASDLGLAFRGMQPILKFLDQSGADIYYVTAAVPPIDELSEMFLEANRFPQDENFYNKSWLENTYSYKVSTIQYLIVKYQPETIILIGDNGEMDVKAYETISQKFDNVYSFIHKLYEGGDSAPVPQHHYTYLTGADLAVQMENLGFLSADQTASVLSGIQKDLESNDNYVLNLVLPSWAEVTAEDIVKAFDTHTSPTPENQQNLQMIKSGIFVF